jgi:hypothetical protein
MRTATGWQWLVSAAVLNVPLAVCHPAHPLVQYEPLRALAVALVLLVIPGLPWVGLLVGRGRLRGFRWVWTIAASLASLLAVLAVIRLSGTPLTAAKAWNGVWLLTNLAMAAGMIFGGDCPNSGTARSVVATKMGLSPLSLFTSEAGQSHLDAVVAAAIFLVAYAGFFYSATRIVPPMEDHDLDVLGCGYGLLTRFEPLMVSDHQTVYQFSHPPLAYFCTAGSFLYFDRLDYLRYYDAAAQRAKAAEKNRPFQPFEGTVDGLSKGTGRHRVSGVRGPNYHVQPPLVDGTNLIPVWLLENGVIGERYEQDPQFVAARTPHVFLAALTVALLAYWAARASGRWWLAVVVALAYASSPEIFVRSGYGGHFATTNFALLILLAAVEEFDIEEREGEKGTGSERSEAPKGYPVPFSPGELTCLLAGAMAALANHKLILVPVAVVLWQLLGTVPLALWRGKQQQPWRRRIAAAVTHPAVLGFAAGTALFWLWGILIDAAEFWRDHVLGHFVDRLIHYNPLGYSKYPDAIQLWTEFWQHTGYVLLPLGLLALLWEGGVRRRRWAGLWLLWTVLAAVAFSLVDWRQTKHLMPLLIPLSLAPARWASKKGTVPFSSNENRHSPRTVGTLWAILLAVVFAGLIVWNLHVLAALRLDFEAFHITAGW